MHNSRQINVGQTIATADPDTKEQSLEALLKSFAQPLKDILAADERNAVYYPAHQQLTRLHDRTRHIASNLEITINNSREWQRLLDEDRHTAGKFAAELFNWERVMTQLEQHAKHWPNFPAAAPVTDANADNLETADLDSISCPPEELRAAVSRQEIKIRELEEQLASLKLQTDAAEQSIDPYVNRLIVTTIGNETNKYPLDKNFVTIGRNPNNDIQLLTRHASRFHARIICDAHSTYIEDMNSANGIMVNSQRTKRQRLRSGDLIVIGRVQLKFIDLLEGAPDEGQA